ncbi:MAG: MarR family winged helix-turn-helix transcriptional regulator [Microbacteriaceae bacterium]
MAATGTLGIDEQICFALYRASRSFTALYRELLAPLGLTYPQYLVLIVLWETPSLTVGALGSALQLDSGTISPLVRRLEAMGLLERERSVTDERIVVVRLTTAGRALQAQAAGIPNQICAATGLDLNDVARLRDQLSELTTSVRGSLEPSV